MKDLNRLEAKLDRLGDELRARPSKARDIMQAIPRAAGSHDSQGPACQSTAWITRPITRYAAAVLLAAGVVVAALWLVPSDSHSGIAFAEVQHAVRQMKTAVLTVTCPNQPEMSQTVYLLETGWFRREHPNGLAFIHDPAKGKILGLNPEDKTAWWVPASEAARSPWTFVDQLLKIEQAAVEELGQREFDGKTLVGFRVGPLNQRAGVRPEPVRGEAWIDPDTRLPVRMEITPVDPEDPTTAHLPMIFQFAFNRPLEKSLFRTTPPEGYRMVEEGPLVPVPAPPKDEALASPVIVPGVGIGQARFGMNMKEIVERLGPPSDLFYVYETPQGKLSTRMEKQDREPVEFDVEYADRGFCLTVDPQRGLISVGTEDGILPGFRAFTGRTREGIAIGAAREDVERAYGPPGRIRGPYQDKTMILIYDSTGLAFFLTDGRVTAIQADKGNQKADP
jgi:hypothetical protein